ncbi:hypothetical protein BKM33_22020 [Salmonella enterica subsp. enterica serovar Infantis]|nr:hypothetical protein BFF41_07760 [Salmonella enterica subsp. enterica serovar Senftenberg]OSM33242.1 hypothetical protein BKM33_22020 [Salmonella enterica subsp. enterica serovar Infantis]OSM33687.1 hypothetical protein BKM34_22495 [Salmonella enterica subsp. enterica serovar Infantis]PHI88586.1 hypothetical protein Y064_17985 [Salmonella enterica subsp. enterica serovar Infantis str. CVM 22582]
MAGVVVVKHHVSFEENHCVARVSAGEWLPDDDVTWLRFARRYLAEAVERHVVQIKIFTTQPPPISAFEVRKVDSAKMIRIPEQGVTVHDTMLELAPQQQWNRPEFQYPAIARQPPRKTTGNLHLAISARQERYVLWVRVKDCRHLSCFLGHQPVIITDTEMHTWIGMYVPTAEQPFVIND